MIRCSTHDVMLLLAARGRGGAVQVPILNGYHQAYVRLERAGFVWPSATSAGVEGYVLAPAGLAVAREIEDYCDRMQGDYGERAALLLTDRVDAAIAFARIRKRP